MLERRAHARANKVFPVRIFASDVGEHCYIARNISATGMFIHMPEPLPLRTTVLVHFSLPCGGASMLTASAKIQNHYYFQYRRDDQLQRMCGVGLRFVRFIPEMGDCPPRCQLH